MMIKKIWYNIYQFNCMCVCLNDKHVPIAMSV